MRDTEHPFYAKTPKEQVKFQWKVILITLGCFAIFCFIGYFTELYFISFFLIAIGITLVAPFLDVPSMKKSGNLIYYSPLFLTEKEKNGVIKFHGGTLLDYIFVINTNLNGKQRIRFILENYVRGLRHVIERYDGSDLSKIKITGTTYIINERTAEKFGLRKVQTNFIQQFILLFNYFNLVVTQSYARGRLSFPKLSGIHTYEGTLASLTEHKKELIKLEKTLQKMRQPSMLLK